MAAYGLAGLLATPLAIVLLRGAVKALGLT